jgi:hypothetical protein
MAKRGKEIHSNRLAQTQVVLVFLVVFHLRGAQASIHANMVAPACIAVAPACIALSFILGARSSRIGVCQFAFTNTLNYYQF